MMYMENRSSHFSPELDPGGMTGLDMDPPSRASGLIPLSLLASQHPGCYTPKSSGTGVILHNQAGNLHSPSLDLRMSPFSHMTTANTQPGLDQIGTQYIAPHNVQKSPDIQQSTYMQTEFTLREWDCGVMDKFEVDPTLDIFSFDSAAKLTTDPPVLPEVLQHEAISNERSHTQGEKSVSFPHYSTNQSSDLSEGFAIMWHCELRQL
jgi:hypothetical protein